MLIFFFCVTWYKVKLFEVQLVWLVFSHILGIVRTHYVTFIFLVSHTWVFSTKYADNVWCVLLVFSFAGYLEFKDVEIQCQQDNELAVKVCMSEHCKSGEFWANVQNACVAIMELIDWGRSRPGSVYDISCSYGVDSAWNFFVEVSIYLLFFFTFP